MESRDRLETEAREAQERAEELFRRISRGEVGVSKVMHGVLYDTYHALDGEGPTEAGAIDDLVTAIDFILDTWRVVGESHQKALELIMNRHRPYVLLLRGFDLEGLLLNQPTADLSELGRFLAGDELIKNESINIMVHETADSGIYQGVATALAEILPVVGIHNMETATPFDSSPIPRLHLRSGEWRTKIDWLIRSAPAIVTCATHATPGVMFEIERLREHHRQDRTVIVLYRPNWREALSSPKGDSMFSYMLGPTDTSMLKYPVLTPGHSSIGDFSHVVSTSATDLGNLLEAPGWTPVKNLTVDARALKLIDRAAALSRLAGRLYASGHYDDTLVTISEAVEIQRGLTDTNPVAHLGGLAFRLGNLALTLFRLGRNADALEVAEESLAAYRKVLEDNSAAHLDDFAILLANLGRYLSALGRGEEALARTSESIETYDAIPIDVNLRGRAEALWIFAAVRVTQEVELPAALDAITQSLAIYRTLAETESSLIGVMLAAHHTFADVLDGLGRNEEASNLRTRISELLAASTPADDIGSSQAPQ